MKCDDAINLYCQLDKNEALPFSLSIHILFCPRCKKIIDNMEGLTNLATITKTNTVNQDSISKLMKRISELEPTQENLPKQNIKWAILQIFLLISPFIIIPMLKIGKLLSDTLGLIFVLPLGLLCAFVVCIACALFVIKNSKYLVKKFDIKL